MWRIEESDHTLDELHANVYARLRAARHIRTDSYGQRYTTVEYSRTGDLADVIAEEADRIAEASSAKLAALRKDAVKAGTV